MTSGSQPAHSALADLKLKPPTTGGWWVLAVQPIQCCQHALHLGCAVVPALSQYSSTKIEA